ncbi:MAG: hypothetical protein J5833_02070, partial [Victivallales bacterium]|nr:hypothetical protein [Victivallales bacterium]
VGEDGAIYVSDGADVSKLSASGGRLIFGNSSGWSDYFPGSAAVAGITVMDGGILQVNSKFALTATNMQIKESAGLELAIVKDADEDYARTELNGTWTANWGNGTFSTVDGVLSGFGGQFGYAYVDPIYGSTYTSARLSMTFLNGAVLDGGDLRGYGYFTVKDGAKVLNTKIKGITANIGASGYASGLSAITESTGSAYDTNIYVYGSGALAEQTVLSGGYMGVERGGVVDGVTMLAPEGYEGPAGDSKTVGPVELEIMAGGSAKNVVASAGVITLYEGSKEAGTGPATLSNADVHSSAMLLVNADGVVLDGALNLGGTVVTTATRYEWVEVEVTDPDTGDTYPDWQRIEKNNAVADATTLTVNFDLTERNGDEETVMIDNLANLQGVKMGTITVSEGQESGQYVLAKGAEEFTGSMTVILKGQKVLGTISVGGLLQASEDVTYKLANSVDNGLVFSVLTTDAAIEDIVATVGEERLQKGRWSNLPINVKVEVNQYSKSIWYRLRKIVGRRGYDEWIELDNDEGLTITEHCDIDFKAVSEKGVDSKIVTYTVNYDGTPAEVVSATFAAVNEDKAYLAAGDECAVTVTVEDDLDDAPTVELLAGDEWTAVAAGEDGCYTFTVTGNGEYVLRTTDHAGNVAQDTVTVSCYGKPALTEVTPEGIAWEVGEEKPCVIVVQDENGAALEFTTEGNAISLLNLPAGDYSVAVGYADDGELSPRTKTLSQEEDEYAASVLEAQDDGAMDVFFTQSVDVWSGKFKARHVGSVNDWNGTREYVDLEGKGKIADFFRGADDDAGIMLLTDAENGDALFLEDVFTELPGALAEQQARIARIDEIRAGAGNDIIDLTSQRFEYVGGGMTVRGGLGNDVIWANKGNNLLFGDAGDDRIVGASGNDVIVGGSGDDSMHGGGGDDIFCFCDDWGNDTVAQAAGGTVTLWFKNGNVQLDDTNLTYTDGTNSVTVSEGISVIVKYGNDGSEQYANLLAAGAFNAFTSERIFENKGMLA